MIEIIETEVNIPREQIKKYAIKKIIQKIEEQTEEYPHVKIKINIT